MNKNELLYNCIPSEELIFSGKTNLLKKISILQNKYRNISNKISSPNENDIYSMTNYSKINNNNHLYSGKNYNYRNDILDNDINFNKLNIIPVQKNQIKNYYRNYKNNNLQKKCQTTYNKNIPQNANFNKNCSNNINILQQNKRDSLNKKNGRHRRSFNTPDIQISSNNMRKYNLNSFENNYYFKNKCMLNDSDIKSNDLNIDSSYIDNNNNFSFVNFNSGFSRNSNNNIDKNLFNRKLNIPLNRKRALTPDKSNKNILNINTINNNKKIQKGQFKTQLNEYNNNLNNNFNQLEKKYFLQPPNIKNLKMNRNNSNFSKNNINNNDELKNSYVNSQKYFKEKLRNTNHKKLVKSYYNKTPSPLRKGKKDINKYFKLSKIEQTKNRNTKSYSQDNNHYRKIYNEIVMKNNSNNINLFQSNLKNKNNENDWTFSSSYNENCVKNNQQQNFNYVYHYSYNNSQNNINKTNFDYNPYIKFNQNENLNKDNNNNSTCINNSTTINKTNTNYKNYSTKISTRNTFDDYTNSTCGNNSKFNKIDSIEEVHFNFINVLQSSKILMKNQENNERDKIISNNPNSSVVILEERDIE